MALAVEPSPQEICGSLPEGCTIRRATEDDNSAILAFQSLHATRAEIGLQFDRTPDFFALLDAHSSSHETWIVVQDGHVMGIGSVVLQSVYVEGRVISAAYLGNLCVAPHRIVSRVWPTAFKRILETLQAEAGVELIYSCVIRSNQLAHASIVKPRRADRASFTHWRGYSNVSILARKPWARRPLHVNVRRAGAPDAERLRAFLDEQSRGTAAGVVFDASTWQRRLRSWPDFGVDRFYVAEDGGGRILGCLAPWDSGAIQRIVLLDTNTSLRAIKWIFNVLAPMIGKPRIGTGQETTLPNIYLSHLAIRDRRADVFAALLDAAYRDLAATRRYATISLCVYDQDPLWDALRPYWHVSVPMDLYIVSPQSSTRSLPLDAECYPGFEIYLV